MKKMITLSFLVLSASAFSFDDSRVTDEELEVVRQEIQKQRQEIAINQIKAQEFKKLSQSTEKLSAITGKMMAEKRAVQEEIANYNKKLECMKAEFPGRECDKYLKKSR